MVEEVDKVAVMVLVVVEVLQLLEERVDQEALSYEQVELEQQIL